MRKISRIGIVAATCFSFFGCGDNQGDAIGADGSNDKTSVTRVSVLSADGTIWSVLHKFCETVPVKPAPDERVQFGNGMFAHIQPAGETNGLTCVQALAFTRTIQNFTARDQRYQETSLLTSRTLRTICRDLNSSQIISDDIREITGTASKLVFERTMTRAMAKVVADPRCPSGTLELVLRLQQ